MSAIQGLVAAGATSFLYNEVDRTLNKKMQSSWKYTALQTNHALLIGGIALKAAGSPMGLFSLTAKGVFFLTPAILVASVIKADRDITPLEERIITVVGSLNYLLSTISSIALLVLGHQGFALASMTVLLLDTLDGKDILPQVGKTFCKYARITAAFFAFVSYANWIEGAGSELYTNTFACSAAALILPAISAKFDEWGQARAASRRPYARESGSGWTFTEYASSEVSSVDYDGYGGYGSSSYGNPYRSSYTPYHYTPSYTTTAMPSFTPGFSRYVL